MTTQYSPIWNNAARTQTCILANVADSGSAANSTILDLRVNSVSKFTVDKFGELIITPTARTSGSDPLISLIAPADTTRAASTEATDINFNLARTVQFAAGNITNQRAIRIQAPTYSFASASTITTASTLSISGPPDAGTNATLTNRWALNVESGDIRLSSNAAIVWPNGISIRDNSPIGSGLTITPLTHVPVITLFANALIRGFYSNHTLTIGHATADIYYSASNYSPDIDTNRIVVRASDGLHVRHSSPTSSGKLLTYNTFTDNSNYERLAFQFGTFSSARHAQIAAESAGTGTANINLVLTPKGTGAFILGPPPDGTTTGGNARGQYAVDLQLARSAATQVASGSQSLIAGGNSNLASGTNATILNGQSNNATGMSSTILNGIYHNCSGYTSTIISGERATAARNGQMTVGAAGRPYGGQNISNSAQYFSLVITTITTGNETKPLYTGGQSPDTFIEPSIRSGTGVSCILMVKAFKSDGSVGARFIRIVDIKNVGNVVSLETTPEQLGTDYNPSGATLTITTNNTAKSLKIDVTGIVNETWRWLGHLHAVEMAYGT